MQVFSHLYKTLQFKPAVIEFGLQLAELQFVSSRRKPSLGLLRQTNFHYYRHPSRRSSSFAHPEEGRFSAALPSCACPVTAKEEEEILQY